MQYLLFSFTHCLLNFFQKREGGEKAITYVEKDLLGLLNIEVLGCRDQYYQSTDAAQLQGSASIQRWGSCNSPSSHARALLFPKGAAPHLSPAISLRHLPRASRGACPSLQTLPWRKNKYIFKRISFPLDQQQSTRLQELLLA